MKEKDNDVCMDGRKGYIYIYTIGGRGKKETSTKKRDEYRAGGEKRGTEDRMRKGNLAVGQADKPLRDFSLALLPSIDVDSKLPRRKAPLSRAVFGKPRALSSSPFFLS